MADTREAANPQQVVAAFQAAPLARATTSVPASQHATPLAYAAEHQVKAVREALLDQQPDWRVRIASLSAPVALVATSLINIKHGITSVAAAGTYTIDWWLVTCSLVTLIVGGATGGALLWAQKFSRLTALALGHVDDWEKALKSDEPKRGA